MCATSSAPPPAPRSDGTSSPRLSYAGFTELLCRLAWRLGGGRDYDTAGLGLPPAPPGDDGWPLLARLQALLYRMHSLGARFGGGDAADAALVRAAATEVRQFLAGAMAGGGARRGSGA